MKYCFFFLLLVLASCSTLKEQSIPANATKTYSSHMYEEYQTDNQVYKVWYGLDGSRHITEFSRK